MTITLLGNERCDKRQQNLATVIPNHNKNGKIYIVYLNLKKHNELEPYEFKYFKKHIFNVRLN